VLLLQINFSKVANIITVIKSKRMRCIGHVACIGEIRNVYKIFWSENLKGRDHSEDLGTDYKIILEWILWK